MQEDDFIEDDGVGGYVDNGMDDWDDPTRKPSSGDEDDSGPTSSVLGYIRGGATLI